MRKLFVVMALVASADARCPKMGVDAFADILHNHASSTIFAGRDYRVENRSIPDFAIESKKRPRIVITDGGYICRYTRKIGKVAFGSFSLVNPRPHDVIIVEKPRPNVVIMEERRPDMVIVEGGHHHRRHHHRPW